MEATALSPALTRGARPLEENTNGVSLALSTHWIGGFPFLPALGKKCCSGGTANLLEKASPGMVILNRTFFGLSPREDLSHADICEKCK